ncbi:hypothetical protein TYRP_015067, partial [Tyrophagus putrescentiae]
KGAQVSDNGSSTTTTTISFVQAFRPFEKSEFLMMVMVIDSEKNGCHQAALYLQSSILDLARPQSCCTMWTPFSATIIVGVFVLQLGTAGITEASMMRKLPIPRTLSRSSTTELPAGDWLPLPIRLLPTSW